MPSPGSGRFPRGRGDGPLTAGTAGAGLLGCVTLPGSTATAVVLVAGVGSGAGAGDGGGGGSALAVDVDVDATPGPESSCDFTTVHVTPTAKSTSVATMKRTMRLRLDEPSSSGGGSVR